jgi:hypothetical protein
MKQKFIKFSLLTIGLVLFSACSKDNNNENTNEPIKGITFSMNEAPYNADLEMEGSRANAAEVIRDTFTINGIEAEVTLERDHDQKPTTRAITSGNHYTIVAFNAGTSTEVASTKGYFDAAGNFKYEAGNSSIRIPAGNYDFVCYTHQFATRSGNTVIITQANADKAFVTRKANVTINNVKQQEVTFTMKHVGARIRTKLMALSDITGVTAALGYQANKAPASISYDMLTGNLTTSTTKNATAVSAAQNYTIIGTKHDAALNDNLTTVTGNAYLAVLAGTKPEELVYNFTGGTVYNGTLNTNGDRKFKAGSTFVANGVYTLTIRLVPKYLYLFEDGKTGHINEGDRKNHVPIAIVFDKIGKRAIALWNANGNANVRWNTNNDYYAYSSVVFSTVTEAVSNNTSGKLFTWEKRYMGMARAGVSLFPPFYYAGKFYTSSDLTSHLNGKTLDANLNQDGRWYLPSLFEWKEVFAKLGFGDGSQVNGWGTWPWKGSLANLAFTVANGTSIVTDRLHWSSSEIGSNVVGYSTPGLMYMDIKSDYKGGYGRVRPFVAY